MIPAIALACPIILFCLGRHFGDLEIRMNRELKIRDLRRPDVRSASTVASRPAISVVVAARNESSIIEQCLKALREQRFALPYEVIVVDNASEDSTAQIAESFGCRVVLEQTPNQVRSKRAGVLSAKGEIIAILDADCVPPPEWLEAVYAALTDPRDTTQLIAVTCCYKFDNLPWWGALYVAVVRVFLIGMYRLLLNSMPFVIGGNVAFKKPYFEDLDLYPSSGGIAQTELGFGRNLNKHGRVGYLPSMSVMSSSRRFRHGLIYFFCQYKLGEYFVPYFRERLFPSTGTNLVKEKT
jgi:glycosyltransferase involved in cell wall biosynthesis